jgi:hypothetical protein
MPAKPITVVLYRCNACHLVQAVEVDPFRTDGRIDRPGFDCICGDYGWTRIEKVV